jgi:hypothetical protein
MYCLDAAGRHRRSFPNPAFSGKDYDSQIKSPIEYFVGAAFQPRFFFPPELPIAAGKPLPPLS